MFMLLLVSNRNLFKDTGKNDIMILKRNHHGLHIAMCKEETELHGRGRIKR